MERQQRNLLPLSLLNGGLLDRWHREVDPKKAWQQGQTPAATLAF